MAKGIQPTPILRGEDAKRFIRDLLNPPNPERRRKILEEARRIYQENPLRENKDY